MVDVAAERRPLREQVTAGDAQARLRPRALRDVALTPGGVVGSVPLALQPVKPVDRLQGDPGGFRVLTLRLDNIAPRVSPAADPRDLGVRVLVGRIGFVAVGLEPAAEALDQAGQLAMPAARAPIKAHFVAGPADDPKISLEDAAFGL